jgi:hypothetical protein
MMQTSSIFAYHNASKVIMVGSVDMVGPFDIPGRI